MTKIRKYLAALAGSLLLLMLSPAQAEEPAPLDANRIVQYIDQILSWDRGLNALDSLSLDVSTTTVRDYLHTDGDKLIKLSLDYARAQNALLSRPEISGKPAEEAAEGDTPNIAKLTTENAANIAHLQGQIATMNRNIARTGGSQRRTLVAQRNKVQSQLDLAQAQRELLTTVSGLLTTNRSDGGGQGLSGKIAELAKLVPDTEATASQQKTATKVVVAKPTDEKAEPPAQDNGIFTLIGNLTDDLAERNKVREIAASTDALHAAAQDHVSLLRGELRATIARGNEIGSQSDVTDPAQIAAQQQELNTLVTRFKLLSAAIAPLAEQNIWIEAAQRGLANWATQLNDNFTETLRALLVRATLLVLAVLVPLFLSRFATRAINTYVRDDRRRRQLRVVQRSILIFVIVVLICLNFFSEFGSLATYAGLITAGLAVALQNVILSIVAHFFFFGRFAVKTGDRVTVNGVTGDIIEMGLVRFYMMEIDDTTTRPHPTGRVVAFPNSILLQQSAFYKQIPGTHYTWRSVTVSLPDNIDYARAQEKLLEAINSVYAGYRSEMENQQSILEHSTKLKVRLPQPEGSLKFAGSALTFEARYPVETGRAAEIDDKVAQAMLVAMRGDAQLSKDGTAVPEIKPV